MKKAKNAGNQHNKLPLDKVIGSYWRVRCTAASKLEWKAKAKAAGMNDSEYTRMKLNEE